jgi:novobiocin biosynthesis protein NovU/D-mycarose 3-C-methyltransferase
MGKMEKITFMNKCRACLSTDLELFLDLGMHPLAGGFLEPSQIAQEKKYPLRAYVCGDCGLVQIFDVIPPDTLFDNYLFSSSTVQYLVNHFANYAKWLSDNYHPEFVVEFGCNDGVLLKPLKEYSIRSVGVDISKNITDMARWKGLNAVTGYFDVEMAKWIRREHGAADIVTGSNAFPHNDNPGIILEAARELLKDNGHLCLEVMYAGALLEKLQWDSMYHEHLSYFCLSTIETLLQRYGFHAVHAEIVPMHAGSLRVVAAVDPTEYPDGTVAEMLRTEYNGGYQNVVTWRKFSENVKRQIMIVNDTLCDLSNSELGGETKIAAYGAAGRATMWLNACNMDYLAYIVDESPLRAGKLMPGTHTPIVYPEEFRKRPPDYCLVTAWNYFEQIKNKHPEYKGVWVLPAPEMRFV